MSSHLSVHSTERVIQQVDVSILVHGSENTQVQRLWQPLAEEINSWLCGHQPDLAKLTLAFWPPLRLAPLSSTIAKSPPGSSSMSCTGAQHNPLPAFKAFNTSLSASYMF